MKAQSGSPLDTKDVHAQRPPAPEREVSVWSCTAADERSRDSPSEDLHRNGWKRPLQWALASGALPAGVVLDGTEARRGNASEAAGAFAFSVTATDSEGRVTTSAAALTVAPRLTIKTLRLKPAKVASAYQAKLATVGGVQPVKWSVVRGTLPPGLKLSQTTGTISGTPRKSGTFRVMLGARDVLGAKSQKTLVIRVTA